MERAYDDRYKSWRKAVLDKCNSCCVKCGSYKDPHCHHIKTWAKFPELRFNVGNGEVLCKECHHLQHPFMIEYERKKEAKQLLQLNTLLARRALKLRRRKERKLRKKNKNKSITLKQYQCHRFNHYHLNLNWAHTKLDDEMSQRLLLDNT